VRGRYKTEAEDFLVEEIPAYEPSGTGDHVWLWVEKWSLSTLDLLADLAHALGQDERSFGIAGLKDAQARSRQWISIEHVDPQRCEGLRGERFAVLQVSRHGNKLRMGHLRGNRFVVVLRGTQPGDLDKVRTNLDEMARLGVPNYFGEQRFGKRGANLEKGLSILLGNDRQAARRMPRRVFGLVVSAVQSEIFNRVVMARLPTLGTLLPGDLAFLHKNGACFPITAAGGQEQARADAFELSPTGPMPGPRMPLPAGEPQAIEAEALAALQLEPRHFADLPFGMCSGERRPLRVAVSETAAAMTGQGLQLAFALPRGSFATSVLRELLVDTIWFAERG
jgi:tRNA pseudouridine13 synthase